MQREFKVDIVIRAPETPKDPANPDHNQGGPQSSPVPVTGDVPVNETPKGE
jgi:hypothetical protein